MQVTFSTSMILGIVAFLSFILLIKAWIRLRDLRKKYSPIVDIDLERLAIQKSIESLKTEKDKISEEFSQRKQKLEAEYSVAFNIYEKLKKEVGLLEESAEMIDVGLYKPHFDFETSDEYRRQIENLREAEKVVIKNGDAVRCETEWSVGGSRAEGKRMTQQINKLMLRAFNGECDAALAKVRWDNMLKMEERLKRAFEAINKFGVVNKSCITDNFLSLKLKELRLTFEYQEKIRAEREEQRRIQEEMREEEKVRREIERAEEEAEKEEKRYQRALEKAKEDILKAKGDEVNNLKEKIAELDQQLQKAQEQKARALSRAQLTKSGHVYIISNIGSLGESVYKIGMTRRLEPLDRIKELGDASVPFPFDIHGMIYSENAPDLEDKMHQQFSDQRINLINLRKEFFSISLDEITGWAANEKIDLKITKVAEAREFRETQAIRVKRQESVKTVVKEELPASIRAIFAE